MNNNISSTTLWAGPSGKLQNQRAKKRLTFYKVIVAYPHFSIDMKLNFNKVLGQSK